MKTLLYAMLGSRCLVLREGGLEEKKLERESSVLMTTERRLRSFVDGQVLMSRSLRTRD